MEANVILDVNNKLFGLIDPVGESHTDGKRFENLEKQIEVTEELIKQIILVARHKDRVEYSMNRSGKKANEFINRLKERLSE